MVEKIRVLEDIEQKEEFFSERSAYAYSNYIVKNELSKYLKYIDSSVCAADEIIMWRVDSEGDLYNCIKAKIYELEVYPAIIPFMVGTVKKASIGFFISDKGIFHINTLAPPSGLELVSGSGTVSIQKGKIMPHIHVVVADNVGSAYGGHLYPGTKVKEYVEGALIKLKGVKFERIWEEKIKAYPLHFIKDDKLE